MTLSDSLNKLSYNKRDAIWWVIIGVVFWWIASANLNLIEYCNDLPLFDNWAYIPAILGNIIFLAIGIIGILASFVWALYTLIASEDFRRSGERSWE